MAPRQERFVKVSQIEQSQGQVVLNIEVEPPELEEHLDRVYRRAVQQVNIRGFRKGKAPRSVVERELGRDAMVEDALETLLPQVTSAAIEEQNLDVVATPRVKVTQNEPLTIEATVAIRPLVVLGDYYQIRLEPDMVEVTTEAVEGVVDSLRRDAGTWEPVERPVELEDMTTINVQGQVDENSIIDDKGIDYILSSESTNPIPGFASQLVGINRGEQREFTLPFPEDYPQANFVGKECHFTVTVEEVKERKLPDIGDEFAKSLSIEGVETVAELMDKLREDMLKHNQQIADQHYQEQAIETLIEGAKMEIPPLMVDEEVNRILSEQAEAMRRQQVNMDDYLSTVGKSVEQLQEEVRPSAVERITRGLTLRALREQEGIEVSPEEVDEELNSMLSVPHAESESLRQLLNSESARTSITNVLLNRKTIERLTNISRGEVIIVASSTESTPNEEGLTESTESERGA
ncbi:trigger factor [SAR202 cluster bacterium AC-647-N09_OGT_505m]|nr:trigger factor [SAR202 cluster bacterium AC-647-N09_OGT_505m]